MIEHRKYCLTDPNSAFPIRCKRCRTPLRYVDRGFAVCVECDDLFKHGPYHPHHRFHIRR